MQTLLLLKSYYYFYTHTHTINFNNIQIHNRKRNKQNIYTQASIQNFTKKSTHKQLNVTPIHNQKPLNELSLREQKGKHKTTNKKMQQK